MYDYRFHLKAQIEYEDAVKWYALRSEKAALNFVLQVENTLTVICQHPHQFKKEFKEFYIKGLNKYPYTIVYKINKKSKVVEIYAVFHQKQHPSKKYK